MNSVERVHAQPVSSFRGGVPVVWPFTKGNTMFLDGVPIAALAKMLEPHCSKAAWPGLDDPAAVRRAKAYARKHGLWAELGKRLDPRPPIATVLHSEFRQFRRSAGMAKERLESRAILAQIDDCALALWLGHDAANLDDLQDRIWALCEMTSWVPGAHEYSHNDLISTAIARHLSEIAWLFRDRLEEEVVARIGQEVQRRVLDPVYDYRNADGWRTGDMNWTSVCNGNTIAAALYQFAGDPWLAATYLHPIIYRLQYFIDGFLDDGACREGGGYWNYGFGHHVDAALMLHHRTGGGLNLMDSEKIRRICRFPLATQIEGPVRACFGDCGNGYIGAEIALAINHFHDMPEMYSIAARHAGGALAVSTLRGLSLYNGQKATPAADAASDCYLDQLGLAKLHAGKGRRRTVLTALAGRNDFPHNHNDVGSFILYRGGKCLLTDPGSPTYTGKTFGPRRYEILQCRSFGHGVPVVNGREQSPGSEYFGVMAAEGVGGDGSKAVTIDMTHAYADPTLKKLLRRVTLGIDGGAELTDVYEFSRQPRRLEEAFVTYEPAKLLRGGKAVKIGSGTNTLILAARCAGRFTVQPQGDESRTWAAEGELNRIAFRPARLARTMELSFRME